MPELKGMRLASAVSWSYRCVRPRSRGGGQPFEFGYHYARIDASTSSAVGEACGRDGGHRRQRRRLSRGSQTHLRGRHLPWRGSALLLATARLKHVVESEWSRFHLDVTLLDERSAGTGLRGCRKVSKNLDDACSFLTTLSVNSRYEFYPGARVQLSS